MGLGATLAGAATSGLAGTVFNDIFGYQDLIQEQMVGETSVYEGGGSINNIKHLAANKTVAWIDYMTNYNRTFGDFRSRRSPRLYGTQQTLRGR